MEQVRNESRVLWFSAFMLLGAYLAPIGAMCAEDCDPLPSCGGIPECMTADDCKLKTWPLNCPQEDGWWQCCNGIAMNERCCVPHCPPDTDAEADAETDTGGSSSSDSGGCSTAGGARDIAGAVLLLAAVCALAGLGRRRASPAR